MREDCADLSEVILDGGHTLMLEQPQETRAAITGWLNANVRLAAGRL